MLDPDSETFVVYVTSLNSNLSPSSSSLDVHLSQMEQCFILRTWLLTIYAVGRYFRLWKLSVFCPLVQKMRFIISRSVTGWHGVWAVGWTQSSLLLFCKDFSLVIGIGQGYWLDDKGLPLVCHLLVRVYRLDDKGAPLEYHRVWWQRTDTSKSSLRQGYS